MQFITNQLRFTELINVFSLAFYLVYLFNYFKTTFFLRAPTEFPTLEPAGHTGVTAHFGHMVAAEDCWPTARSFCSVSRRHKIQITQINTLIRISQTNQGQTLF